MYEENSETHLEVPGEIELGRSFNRTAHTHAQRLHTCLKTTNIQAQISKFEFRIS